MIRQVVRIGLFLALALSSKADTLTFSDGKTVKGAFQGFANRKFLFTGEDGVKLSEYPLKVKSIVPGATVTVSVELARKRHDSVEFVQVDHNTFRFKKDGQTVSEPVIMLKTVSVVADAGGETLVSQEAPPAGPVLGAARISPTGAQTREWHRTGKWREMAADESNVISRGEEVDVETFLKKGLVNVVHFHLPTALTSVREGNYLDSLAAKKSSRIAVLKVTVKDFEAPICTALKIKSLPQFWVYDAQGKLAKKLTDRFTEGDIDAAIKEARRGRTF